MGQYKTGQNMSNERGVGKGGGGECTIYQKIIVK